MGLFAPAASAAPDSRLDCELLARRGPPPLSLEGRESVQFQLIVNRAAVEAGAGVDRVALARSFGEQWLRLSACEVARAGIPALSTTTVTVADGLLVLQSGAQRQVVDFRTEMPGRFADEVVRRLASRGQADSAARTEAERLLWAAWVEALLDSRDGVGEHYLYADELQLDRPASRDVISVRDCCRAYLRVRHFTEFTTAQLADALTELGRAGISDLVIDLRGNSGGRLSLAPLELFIPKGEVLALRRAFGGRRVTVLKARLEAPARRLALLVDGDTASMAELFAAGLQAIAHAPLLGSRTHGKSTGQRRHPVGGEGLLVLDAAEYFHPGTRESWARRGLRPDLALAPTPPPEAPAEMSLDELVRSDDAIAAAFAELGSTSRSGRSSRP
jgi:hypothetical protein